ncbi:hypothetical protein RIF29_23466 [Crotalaria pallida]|uniref:Uncharacterized protein n=1 Tax=Crotalaria pallida TaxID=3830 RepID=A0AAN9FA65_CROPI
MHTRLTAQSPHHVLSSHHCTAPHRWSPSSSFALASLILYESYRLPYLLLVPSLVFVCHLHNLVYKRHLKATTIANFNSFWNWFRTEKIMEECISKASPILFLLFPSFPPSLSILSRFSPSRCFSQAAVLLLHIRSTLLSNPFIHFSFLSQQTLIPRIQSPELIKP